MKKLSTEITLSLAKAGKLDKNTLQLILLVITLGMLVIGAAAPVAGGGPG